MLKRLLGKIKYHTELNWKWIRIYRGVKREYYKYKDKDFYILTGTPLHGNLGDHAITLAEYQLLKDMDDEMGIVEIPSFLMQVHPSLLKKIIGGHKILVNGGGFLGSLWEYEEKMVRNVIRTYPNNTVVIFPQTAYFEEDERGREVYQSSKKIYASHEKLHICVRERVSYSVVCEMIKKENVHLYPDMVAYLKFDMSHVKEKSGVLLCLRKDKEKVLTAENEKELERILKKYFQGNCSSTDTVVPYDVSKEVREEEVKRKVEEFAKHQLVITDRLHGMVFAALAGTPCITFGNCNYKVEGVYEWIKHNMYIRFWKEQALDGIEEVIEELLQLKDTEYDNDMLQSEYTGLKKLIKNA